MSASVRVSMVLWVGTNVRNPLQRFSVWARQIHTVLVVESWSGLGGLLGHGHGKCIMSRGVSQ